MTFRHVLLATTLAGAFIAPALVDSAWVDSAWADSAWPVLNRLQGKVKDGNPEKADDVSGIACAPGPLPRLCLVVDDETQGAQVVILRDGLLIAGDFIPLIDDVYDRKPLELDAEGVAYADGFFYVVGSHGRAPHADDADKEAKNAARAAASRRIFRIALTPDAVDLATGTLKSAPVVTPSAALATILGRDPVIAPSFDRPLGKDGITIEGVAVRGADLYAGLRGPVLDDGSAVIARVPLAAVFDGAQGAATLFRLGLDKDTQMDPRGIRDLAAFGDGFLLIAGPEPDPPKKHRIALGDYAIYSWTEGEAPVKRLDLQPTGKTDMPEALLVLDADAEKAQVLLMFDGPKEGQPMPVDIPLK
jgi:hypothetical protein